MRTYLSKTPIRVLAFTVIFAMVAGLLPAIPQEASAATASLQAPRTAGDGTVTWDCVWFGHYPQSSDGNGGYKNEKVKWRILSINGDEALLLADKNLDCKRYHETYTNVTWENSTIRSWLNNGFINKAFTARERDAIKRKTIRNSNNPEYGTKGGNDTADKVFLLSIEEAAKPAYGFPSEYSVYSKTRRAVNTEYAKSQGAWTSTSAEYKGGGGWWLRSPGSHSGLAAEVSYFGSVYHYGFLVGSDYYAVRPALSLDLKSSLWSPAGMVSSEGKVEEIGDDQGSKGNLAAAKPKKVTLSKVKSAKRGTLKLTWKRDKKATGYQAIVATDKKFKKSKKSAFIPKNKTVTKTFTKLKQKKTYFAKVRAYKKIGKTKVYGAYSKVKKGKVK